VQADVTAKLQEKGPDELYEFARQLQAEGETGEAKRAYEFLAEKYPKHKRAPYSLWAVSQILGERKRYEDAVSLLEGVLDQYPDSRVVSSGYVASHLTQYLLSNLLDFQGTIDVAESQLDAFPTQMLDENRAKIIERMVWSNIKLGDPTSAREALDRRLPECLFMLRHLDYYKLLIALQQQEAAQLDETAAPSAALSIARAAYALCDFDEKAIRGAVELVRSTYMSLGNFQKSVQFIQSQEDPQKVNPLREVPMPRLAPERKEQLLGAAGDEAELAILVHLYAGDITTALSTAKMHLIEAPSEEAVEALMHVARTLKAMDLNIVRANQFIIYAKTGEGDNPLLQVVP